MPEEFTRWDVTDDLRTKEDIRLYLEACAEEGPGDGSLIRTALNDIAVAKKRSGPLTCPLSLSDLTGVCRSMGSNQRTPSPSG